jgi:hypothetical protein
MQADGACPACGRHLADPPDASTTPGAPWHFKLLVVAVVLYLGWRLVQLVGWLVT